MGWQGARCLAGLAAWILEPEGIGLVGVPAPTHRHGVGLRDLPGRMGDVLGLVGFEGRRRSLEQVVGRAATAVAREGGGGTAAAQATSWTPCSRSSSAVTQIFGFYCVPGAAARQLLALGAAPGWGDAGAGGARGMVRGVAGSGVLERVGGGRPGRGAAAAEAAAGRCSARLGSARLDSARRGSARRLGALGLLLSPSRPPPPAPGHARFNPPAAAPRESRSAVSQV